MKKYNYRFERIGGLAGIMIRPFSTTVLYCASTKPNYKYQFIKLLSELYFPDLKYYSKQNMPMTFKEYYKYYLTLHTNINCIRLHFLGQLCTIALIAFIIINSFWILIPLVPFVVYPFTIIAHKYFEKNVPAAKANPVWAKISNIKMFIDILRGDIKII